MANSIVVFCLLFLVCCFDMGNIEGTSSMQICVWCLCMYVLLYICVGTNLVDLTVKEKEFTSMKRVLKYDFAYGGV